MTRDRLKGEKVYVCLLGGVGVGFTQKGVEIPQSIGGVLYTIFTVINYKETRQVKRGGGWAPRRGKSWK